MTAKRFQNKIVLISGASSGIGAATAIEFAREGALVILVARNLQKLNSVAETIRNSGGNAKIFQADVSDYNVVQQLATMIKTEIGVPDILINNAGQGTWKFIEETEYAEVAKMMAVPYFAAFYMTKSFLPEMQKRNLGHIVNMTSYAGFIAFSGATAYIAARNAMIGFNNALASDLYDTNIRVSLAYFAKVKSEYWENNPGSEERLPGAQILIPVITSQRVARELVNGVFKNKRKIRAPFMIYMMDLLIRYTPFISRLLINKTGFRKRK